MKSKLHLRGWIRVSTRHSETMQRDALAEVGCTAIYVEGQDTWEQFVKELRKGEIVCVTTFGRLSSRRNELAPRRRDVHAKKCHVWEVTTDRRSNNADDAADMMADAAAEQTGDARALPPKEAARRGAKGGKVFGENAAQRRTSEVEAKSAWYDPNGGSVADRLARPQMRGWTKMTAFRRLGKTK